jgi:hypothetical protein
MSKANYISKLEDGDNIFIRKIGIRSIRDAASHPRKMEFITRNYTWCYNKVRELIAVKVLHTSLLNATVVTFKVLPFGSYAPIPAPSTLQNNFGTDFVERPSELPLYYS